MEDWIKAGKIAKKAIELGTSLIKKDAKVLDVINKIEDFIEKQAIPAFPTQISINNIAAHYTSTINDTTTFKQGDICKLDLGVSINGAIADTAITKEIGNKNNKLVQSSKKALDNVLKIIKPGITLSEIGKVIEDTIKKEGFQPIRNLSGHGLERYEVHSGITIPNYDTKDNTKLKKNQTIAIEPFATTGNGLIKEGKPSSIYRLINSKPIRSPTSRKILKHIQEKYKTLPFCTRQLAKHFNPLQVRIAINELTKAGNIYEYTQLPESTNGLVSQHEHTIIVKEKSIVTTI